REPVRLEREIVDDPPLQQADRIARHRVAEAGMELLGHGGTADARMTLEHDDTKPRPGEIRRADEAVVTAADDRGVVSHAEGGIHRQLRPKSGSTDGVYNTLRIRRRRRPRAGGRARAASSARATKGQP